MTPDFLKKLTPQQSMGVFEIDFDILYNDFIPENENKMILFSLLNNEGNNKPEDSEDEDYEDYENNSIKQALIYTFDTKGLTRYLHDQINSDETFHRASLDITKKLMYAHKKGVAFVVADLYHDKKPTRSRGEDYGFLHIFPGLTADKSALFPGQTERWEEAVQFPNFRGGDDYSQHGIIADLGDRIWLSDYFDEQDPESVRPSLRRKINSFEHCRSEMTFAENKILSNILAEDLYVLFLIGGLRAKKLSKQLSKEEGDLIWEKVAKTLLECCIETICSLTNVPKDIARRFLTASVGDIGYLARQMQYWMTTQYVSDVLENKIADNIYEHGTTVNIKMFSQEHINKYFHQDIGFCIDGKTQALGAVNSPNPVTKVFELMSATLWMTFSLWKLEYDTIGEQNIEKSQFFENCDPYAKLYPITETSLKMDNAVIHVFSKKETSTFQKIQRKFRESKEKREHPPIPDVFDSGAPT